MRQFVTLTWRPYRLEDYFDGFQEVISEEESAFSGIIKQLLK